MVESDGESECGKEKENESESEEEEQVIKCTEKETAVEIEAENCQEHARTEYRGYVPHALVSKPTSPALGELPTLEHLVKGSLPPLNKELQQRSEYYYKERVPEENITVSLPPLAIPPREDFLTRFKRGAKLLRPDYYKRTPQQYSEDQFKRFLSRRWPQWVDRYNDVKENARRRAEKERREEVERRNEPGLPAEIIATPKPPIAPTQTGPVRKEPRRHRAAEQKFVERSSDDSSEVNSFFFN